MAILFPDTITAVDYTVSQNKMEITKVAGTPYTIQADIQPEKGEDDGIGIKSSEQSRKEIGLVKVYSETRLNVAKEGVTLSGTVLDWEGRKWEVIQEGPYQKGGLFAILDHYKYKAQLLTDKELVT
jgi:hypothetical protein